MEIGFCVIPRAVRDVETMAQIADKAGAGWFGLADSPYLFSDPHTAAHAALRVTGRIRVGTFVTNPVTRHWSVQAGIFRTLEEIAPGRLFMGIAAGDSAVHSVGLRPATPDALADYVQCVRDRVSPSLEVMVAAGGPRAVKRAARYADHLVVGQGVSAASRRLMELGAAEAGEVGPRRPLRVWLPLIVNVVPPGAPTAAARAPVKATLVAFSRQAFAGSFDEKGVEPAVQRKLRELYRGYTFEEHSVPGESRNAQLLPSGGDLEDFLFDRFTAVGPADAIAARLVSASEATGVTNFILTVEGADPISLMKLTCEEVLPRLPDATAGFAASARP